METQTVGGASDLCSCVLERRMEETLGETGAKGKCRVSFPHLCIQPRPDLFVSILQ